ncbi:Glutamate--cysteine ligase [Nosema granulosis]|uniref:Glutamate--cysteine ligase n=1 Tax=Nosema granulosis TaxID=83296 RepID=A0A9P6GYM3_9MICR|nr:Glutamate--cysteine ligase [Nosema granulosis]
MGLLKSGDILSWEDLKAAEKSIKERGIDQFVKVYRKNKLNYTCKFAFGDELELITLILKEGKYMLYCGSENIVGKTPSSFVEYARYMVEISALVPFNEQTISDVEKCIQGRIDDIEKISPDGVEVAMIPCFFNLTYDYFYDTKPLVNDVTLSLNFPFNGVTQHKRFTSFTENIRNRRGRKIEGYIEIMKDKNTTFDPSRYVLVDSMGQGMGCCGLQVTIQGETMANTRFLYDMLAIISPLVLRMTRGSPISSGKLINTETRWQMLEMSVDCRTDEERGSLYMRSDDPERYPYGSIIPKSRFSPVDFFISDHNSYMEEYNDIHVPLHDESYTKLIEEDVDVKLARHISSLFIRDPVVAYRETNEETFDDFENIQSSNWRSVRFKIPAEKVNSNLQGWKVELRSMEMQATVFENTAFIYLGFLLSEAIILYNLNLYIPISLVDTNFRRANAFVRNAKEFKKGALAEDTQTFYYRRNIKDSNKAVVCSGTLKTIFLGDDEYKGLLMYVYDVIDDKFREQSEHLKKYIRFIEDKLNNKYISLSDWIRRFVINHSEYKHDSIVHDSIIFDLTQTLLKIRKNNNITYLKNEP